MASVVAGVWLVLAVGAVAVSSVRFARLAAPGAAVLLRALVALMLAWAQIAATCLGLGAVHALYPGAVLAVHVVVAVVALRLKAPGAPPERVAVRGAAAVVLVGLAGLTAYWAALSVGGPTQEYDTNYYHAVNAAHWLDAHETWSLPYAQAGDHTAADPGNGEILGLWLMLPTHDDRLAYLANAVAAMACILATAAIAAELGGRAWAGALMGATVLASPFAYPQLHSLMTDVPAGAAIAASAAFALGGRRGSTTGAWPLLTGIAAGLAAGTKYADLLPALACVALAVVLTSGGHLRVAVVSLGALSGFLGFWLLRNLIATGDPVYPQSVSIAGHTLAGGSEGRLVESRIPLIAHLTGGRAGQALTGLGAYLAEAGVPLLVTVAAGLVALALRRLSPQRRRVRPEVWWTLGLVLVCLAAYVVTPYTGGGDDPSGFTLGFTVRFLVGPALVLAAIVAALSPPPLVIVAVGISLASRARITFADVPGRSDLDPDAARVAFGFGVAAITALGCSVGMVGGPGTRSSRLGRPTFVLASVAGGVSLVAGASTAAADPVLERAVAARGGAVVVVNVQNVRRLLGPDLAIAIESVGRGGTEGARGQIEDPQAFTVAIEAMHPAAVVIGHHATDVPPPPGWRPPPRWQLIGRVGDDEVYGLP